MRKQKRTTIEAAIARKRTQIGKWQKLQSNARWAADDKIADLQRKIDRENVLIGALERGELKP